MDRTRSLDHVETALRAHRKELERFVAARVSVADADDILQIAAMRAIENADRLADPEKVLPWLYQIHRTVAVDVVRKRTSEERKIEALAAEPQLGVPSSAPDALEESVACGCSLEQARQLNPRYAAILGLVDIGGASLKEAARSLGVTVNTATVRLHRARKALKEKLMAHCGVQTMRGCNDCRCTYDGCCPT